MVAILIFAGPVSSVVFSRMSRITERMNRASRLRRFRPSDFVDAFCILHLIALSHLAPFALQSMISTDSVFIFVTMAMDTTLSLTHLSVYRTHLSVYRTEINGNGIVKASLSW